MRLLDKSMNPREDPREITKTPKRRDPKVVMADVVGHLKGPADRFTEATKPCNVIIRRACAESTRSDCRANQRSCFRTVNVLEHLRTDSFAFGFNVRDLAADHSVDGSSGGCDLGEHFYAAIGADRRVADGFKSESQKRVASENGCCFAELFMTRRFAASQIVIVESWQIVVNK